MNRKEALEILGFSSNDTPSEREITIKYRNLAPKVHPGHHQNEPTDIQKQYTEKFIELDLAYKFLTQKETKNQEETKKYKKKSARSTSEDLDINSAEDLKFHLHAALLRQDITFLKKLFSKFKSSKGGKFGDYINEKHFGGDLPLFSAISSGNVELVKLLLDNGADFNVRNKYGESPLHKACSEGHGSIVELLLKCGANPNVQNGRGKSPLYRACSEGHDGIVKLLLEHGADPNMKDQEGKPPLIFAFKDRFLHENEVRVISLLLEHNADPNVQDEYGELPLHKACSSGCYNIVKLLLEKGVDPNVQNGRGRFPLHTVSFRGYDGIVKLLLKYKANPNVQDGNGESPLHYALLWWHYNIAELLLKNRANPNVPDKNGKFPLNRARSSGRNDIAQLLLRNGADSGLKDKDDKKPIDRAFLRSNGGKPFNHKKAFWLGIAALLATAGSIALASGVADAYIGEVWCSVLAAVIAIIALCCVCCAAKTRLPPSGPSSVLYETSAEFSNSQKSLSPAGGA